MRCSLDLLPGGPALGLLIAGLTNDLAMADNESFMDP